MKVVLDSDEYEYRINITGLSSSHLKQIFLSLDNLNNIEQVWIDTYSTDETTPTVQSKRTYGWISVDEAEQIAMALLMVVKEARENRR